MLVVSTPRHQMSHPITKGKLLLLRYNNRSFVVIVRAIPAQRGAERNDMDINVARTFLEVVKTGS